MIRATKQFMRYALVGLLSNSIGYCVYLLITWQGFDPKVTMSFLYMFWASLSFFGNRQWVFAHCGNPLFSAIRYALVHLTGYCINLLLLLGFVDGLAYPHQWVQAAAVPIVAIFLFISFRYFVFPQQQSERKSQF